MKKVLFATVAFAALTAFTVLNSTWKNDPSHSQFFFTITHMGISDISGTFGDYKATIESSEPDFSDAKFEFVAQTASIDTRVEARDNHLRNADFFDAEKYPTITFKSTKLMKTAENRFKVTGNLTVHGVTREETMDLIYRGQIENPKSKSQTAGFHLSGEIKRSDYQIGTKFPELAISDKVRIEADGEFGQ